MKIISLIYGVALGAILCATSNAQAVDPSPLNEEVRLLAVDGAIDDAFGFSIAVSGDTAVVASYVDDIGTHTNQGSVYLFERSGGTWVQRQKLVSSDGAAFDLFGYSVALSGDTLVVGAIGDEVLRGAAYVFVRSGGTWTEQQKLVADDRAEQDSFGYSVALSGDTIIVGADSDTQPIPGAVPLIEAGSAYVFVRSGSIWTQQQKLLASDITERGMFGRSVAVSGDTALIGATRQPSNGNDDQGAAYVFVRSGSVWTQRQRLVASDGAADDSFGESVALVGDTAVIAAVTDDVGSNVNQGSAYVFVRGSNGNWTQQQRLVADDGAFIDFFGSAVALSGDTVVVGAYGDDIGSNVEQGSAYVFTRNGATWTQRHKLVASAGAAHDDFGAHVAVSGDTVVVGASTDLFERDAPGAAYVFGIPRLSDYGDAPDPGYPTLLAHDGARHSPAGPKLGASVDTEADGQPNSGATGDDIAGGDDEDGVNFGTLTRGASAAMNVLVSGGPALFDAWIDFNDDGDWADAGERIFNHQSLGNGANDGLVFQVPTAAVLGQTYARTRLSSTGVTGVTGAAPDGEVEDQIVTITVAGGAPSLSIVDASIAEGNSGTKNLSFTVTLSSAASSAVTVKASTANGTATAGNDYTATSSTLSFSPGQKSKTFSVAVKGDTSAEPNETFLVNLGNATGATIADGQATGTITNDDASAGPRLSVNDVRVTEGKSGTRNATFTVSLSPAAAGTVTVTAATAPGTAAVGKDYTAKSSTLTFGAGSTSKSFSVVIKGDKTKEPDETFFVNLGNAVGATISDAQGLGTIVNDD